MSTAVSMEIWNVIIISLCLVPTFLSQGNGNYRDVNQNRRNDVWFNRDVKESSLVNFLNLIQADGYNPLIVKGAIFVIKDEFAMMVSSMNLDSSGSG